MGDSVVGANQYLPPVMRDNSTYSDGDDSGHVSSAPTPRQNPSPKQSPRETPRQESPRQAVQLSDHKTQNAVYVDEKSAAGQHPLNSPEEALTFWGIIKRGFFLIKYQQRKAVIVSVGGFVPLGILVGLVMAACIANKDEHGRVRPALLTMGISIVEIIGFFTVPPLLGMIAHLGAAAHYGEVITIKESFVRTWRRLPKLIGAHIIFFIGFGILVSLLLIPGIWFACTYALVIPVVLLENITILKAFSRARFLSKGRRWQVGGVLALCAPVLSLGVGLSVVIITLLAFTNGAFWVLALAQAAEMLVFALVMVPLISIFVAFYFDARERNQHIRSNEDEFL